MDESTHQALPSTTYHHRHRSTWASTATRSPRPSALLPLPLLAQPPSPFPPSLRYGHTSGGQSWQHCQHAETIAPLPFLCVLIHTNRQTNKHTHTLSLRLSPPPPPSLTHTHTALPFRPFHNHTQTNHATNPCRPSGAGPPPPGREVHGRHPLLRRLRGRHRAHEGGCVA